MQLLIKETIFWTLKPGKQRQVLRISTPHTHVTGGLPHMLPEMPVMQHDTLNKQPQIFLPLLQQNFIIFSNRVGKLLFLKWAQTVSRIAATSVRALPVQVLASSAIPAVGLFQVPASLLKQRPKRCMIWSKFQVQYCQVSFGSFSKYWTLQGDLSSTHLKLFFLFCPNGEVGVFIQI